MEAFSVDSSEYRAQQAVGPVDPLSNEYFKSIDQETQSDVDERFGIRVTTPWYCCRISECVIKAIIAALATDLAISGAEKASLNFYYMLEITVKNRISDAEKEGNINVSFIPGPRANALIPNGIDRSVPLEREDVIEHFRIELPDRPDDEVLAINRSYYDIARKAALDLSSNYRLVVPEKYLYHTYAITEQFLINTFQKLLTMLANDPKLPLASLNFFDLIEFHAQREQDGEIKFYLRPGVEAKLVTKSDETTEAEYSEYDPTNWRK